ncbi:cytochrome c peroxidase [Flavobacterium sp. KACC 22758]|uniref:cytochrome-c peroxidase n=1 Tax=Flavobacterium sp. KACC 22758 TaxID=3025667 RepID=UPI002366423D|nr:cytochrome c peroxidase [Flavobacterium sp. KACC 22758]WDF59519.1 cytochrome c peroxidase [Flavobacterium sp. KACC 22758]
MKTKLIGIGAMVVSLIMLSYAKIEPNLSISELKKLYSSGDYQKWPKPEVDSIVYAQGFEDIGILGKPEFPENNPYTEEKAELGKVLFFDPRLSKSGQISCANCHDPELNWGDARRVSYGEGRQQGNRNAPSLMNIAYSKVFFWDGRAETLEDQASFPIKDAKEMNFHIDLATKRLNKIKGYKPYFKKAFGKEKLTQEEILKAIATFERTLITSKSKFDRFIEGDSTQLTNKQVEGLHLFRTKARCINCHNTANFADNKFHNVGLTYYGREYQDLGRYNVTGKAENVGEFKTQSLRGVAQNAPYMHNGLFPNLRGVLNIYNAGMPQPKRKENQLNDTLFPTTSKLIQKLNLSKSELDALEDFIMSLSSTGYRMKQPLLPQ